MEQVEEIKEVLATKDEEEIETEEQEQTTEVESDVEESKDKKEEDAKDKPSEDKPKKQTSDERKRFAEMRRAKEAKEREEALEKAKKDGIIEGLGGINPYTNEKIVDDIDYELYQEMKDAESKGYNPNELSDMRKYRKEMRQAELKAEEEANRNKLDVKKDVDEFIKNNPDVNVKELLSDEKFLEFAEGMLGTISLDVVYKKYNSFNHTATKKAEEIALEEKARRASSVGSLGSGEQATEEYTIDKISQMSREEIAKNYDKVLNSYFKKK